MSENLFATWLAEPRRVAGESVFALIGGAGDGKTLALSALMDTVHQRDQRMVVTGASQALLRQYDRTAVGRSTVRTAPQYEAETPGPGAYEVLRLSEGQTSYLVEAWAGEDSYADGATDLAVLIDRLRARGVHRVFLTTNPFRGDSRLAEWAFFELAWMWQERAGFDLGRAAVMAAKGLWRVSEKGLEKLYSFWPRLAKEMAGARLVREPMARFGLPVTQAFHLDNVSAEQAAAVMTGLRRMPQVIAALTAPTMRLLRETARAWHDTAVLVTHAGYLAYLPGLSRGDLLQYGCSIYPDPDAARISQVVIQESLKLTLSCDAESPTSIEGLRPEAEELLAAIRRPPMAVPVTPRANRRFIRRRPGIRAAWPWLAGAGLLALGVVALWAVPAAAIAVLLTLLLVVAGAALVRGRPLVPPSPAADVPPAIARRARPVEVPTNGHADAGG